MAEMVHVQRSHDHMPQTLHIPHVLYMYTLTLYIVGERYAPEFGEVWMEGIGCKGIEYM